jgi:hypothetical protein
MMNKNLGRLERVELRDIWLSEASDFTPWLARKENLDILGETLGIDLALEAQERPVGPFRADILCKDIGTDRWVLIENQLERTDHNHLGQLLTMRRDLRPSQSSGLRRASRRNIVRLSIGSTESLTKAFASSGSKSNSCGLATHCRHQNLTSCPSPMIGRNQSRRLHGQLPRPN